MSENNEVRVSKGLTVQMLVYMNIGKTCINVKTRELTAMKNISGIPVYAICGGKCLQDCLFGREVKFYRTERRGRKSEHVEIARLTGFPLMAKMMSIQLPISGDDVKRLLVPYLEKQVAKIYLYTKAGSLGLPSMIEPQLCLERYGFKNCWESSGTRPVNDWSYVNNLLRQRNSPYRILTGSLDLGAEKELEIEVELKKALKRIEQLEKEGRKDG